MPYLRFTRDRRGYEHLALVQDSPRKGRDRARILYLFRTPPGVRIGRDAFDPGTLGLIERANPSLSFDWDAILEARAAGPEEDTSARRDGRKSTQTPGIPGDRRQPAVRLPTLDRVLGRDAAMRLRQRFAAVRQRLDENPGIEPEQLAVCRARLAEFDPDSWSGEEIVRSRSLEFDAAIEEIRRTLGLPKRRSRRAGRRDEAADAQDRDAGSSEMDGHRRDSPSAAPAHDAAARVDPQSALDAAQPRPPDSGGTPAGH